MVDCMFNQPLILIVLMPLALLLSEIELKRIV